MLTLAFENKASINLGRGVNIKDTLALEITQKPLKPSSERENPSIPSVNGGGEESIHPLWEEFVMLVFSRFTRMRPSPESS